MDNRKRISKDILFLLAGAFFLFFSNGRWSFPLAAWLYPLFLLSISRYPFFRYCWLILPLLTGICSQLSFWKFTYDDPQNILFYLPFFLGMVPGLLFCIDRLLYSPRSGFITTLYFPLLYTSFDFINNLVNPFGSTGVLGYTQFDFLSFCQLAAITGMWGLTFMITWFGSVIIWCTDNAAFPHKYRKGLLIYCSLWTLVIAYGGLRLAMPLPKGTVRIAAMHTYDKDVEGELLWKYFADKNIGAFNNTSNANLSRMIDATRREAAAGARIVVWSEVSPKILQSAVDSVTAVCSALAREQGIYLLATPFSISPQGGRPENKLLLFSPDGAIVLTHYKYGGNFLEGSVEGDKKIKAVTTPYGKLAAIICWDADFPATVRQIGLLQTDILLNPASDWKEITPLHSIVAIFRGIENGCSVVREDRNGLSIVSDPRGKTIAMNDHFTSDRWVMTAEVPDKRIKTLYPLTGDLFGWLSLIGLLFLLCSSIFRSKAV